MIIVQHMLSVIGTFVLICSCFFFFLIIQWLSHYDFNTYVMIALTLTTCKCHNEIVVYVCPDFAVQLTYCIYHLLNLMCDDQG